MQNLKGEAKNISILKISSAKFFIVRAMNGKYFLKRRYFCAQNL